MATLARNTNSKPVYSSKVFVGAVPPGTNEQHLQRAFSMFDDVEITWPNKGASHYPTQGYVFIVFKRADAVNRLLANCLLEGVDKYMYLVGDIQRMVQIRPFALENATYVVDHLWFRFIRLSVFVGGLPRSCTARDLTVAVSSMFGPVLQASIELDFFNSYPKGAARVVFRHISSYKKAAMAGHISMEIAGNNHRVELKPFFHHGISCEMCSAPPEITNLMCMSCVKYFCKSCWDFTHKTYIMSTHQPLKDSKRDLPTACRTGVCVPVSAPATMMTSQPFHI